MLSVVVYLGIPVCPFSSMGVKMMLMPSCSDAPWSRATLRTLFDSAVGFYPLIVVGEHINEIVGLPIFANQVLGVKILIDAIGDHAFTYAV